MHLGQRCARERELGVQLQRPFVELLGDFPIVTEIAGAGRDELLRRLAGVVCAGAPLGGPGAPPEETASRYGGDVFAVLIPGVEPEVARVCAERIRAGVERLGPSTAVTVSASVAVSPEDGVTQQALIDAAERALRAAKGAGGNRVHGGGDPAA